jgi:hypothetical protein
MAFSFSKAQILFEDFESGSLPANWSIVTAASDSGWKFGVNTVLESPNFPILANTSMACTNDDNCNCDKSNDILITPSIDLSSYTNVFMSYEIYYFSLSFQAVTEEAKIIASVDGGITWNDVLTIPGNTTNGWQTNYCDLSAFVGNSNVKIGFKYNDGGEWLYGMAIDNVSIYEPTSGIDLAVSRTIVGKNDPRPVFTEYARYLTGLPLNVQSVLTNYGTSPITSFDYSWNDGTNIYNQTITGVNIAPLTSYTLTATVPYSTLAGTQTITATISNVNNGASELSTANNSSSFVCEGITAHPDRNFFAEEATGTWCQWCPRGAVFMNYMYSNYGDKFVGVAVHNNDPMVVSDYDSSFATISGGQTGVIPNREVEIDPSELEAAFIDEVSNAPMVVVGGTATVNINNNEINIDLNANFTMNMSGDFRFMAIVAEDSVTGTSSAYDQSNSYGNNQNGPMGGFENLSTVVPAILMNYNFVNRLLLGTFNGQSGSIPGSVVSGTPYTYSFTGTADPNWDKNQLYVAGVVIDAGSGIVLNAIRIPVTTITAFEDPNNILSGSYIYPTTTNDIINLMLRLEKSTDVMITVTDMFGKLIMSQDLGTIAKGESKMLWNVSSLASGMYNLTATSAEGRVSMKFVKN